MVNMFSDVPGRQFEAWQQTYLGRLSLMSASFHEQMRNVIHEADHCAHRNYTLSDRERDCVAWLASGLRVSAIAHKMKVSERTVEFHLANARKKTNSPTRDSMIARVIIGGFRQT